MFTCDGQYEIVKLLLAYMADVLDIQTVAGFTPLMTSVLRTLVGGFCIAGCRGRERL